MQSSICFGVCLRRGRYTPRLSMIEIQLTLQRSRQVDVKGKVWNNAFNFQLFLAIYLTSSLRISSPLVQMTVSLYRSGTSRASQRRCKELPALRCLSPDFILPESSIITSIGAAIGKKAICMVMRRMFVIIQFLPYLLLSLHDRCFKNAFSFLMII